MLVTGIHYRHPAVLANMASALDIVSNGRLELGIGAGWNEEESGAYGIELGSIKERFDRFEEACEVLTGLLTQETTTLRREVLPAQGRPQRAEGPAAAAPARSASAAAARSAPCRSPRSTPTTGTSSAVRPRSSRASATCWPRHCADIGRDPKEITLSAHVRLSDDRDYQQVVDDAAALGAEGLDLAIIYLPPPYDPAVLEPLAEAIRDSGLLTQTLTVTN